MGKELKKPDAIDALIERIPAYEGENIGQTIALMGELTEIKTPEIRDQAGGYIRRLGQIKKDAESFFKPWADAANRLHKAITGKRKKQLEPIDAESRRLGKIVLAFDDEQDRKRREYERKLQMEMEAKLAAEREAEREAAGDNDDGEELPPPPPVQFTLPDHRSSASVSGIATQKRWTFKVESMEELVKAVADGRAPIGYLYSNDVAIRAAVTTQKETFSCPGIKAWPEKKLKTFSR